MADLNFPNPGVQTTYTFVGKTWNWDGQRWAFASSGSGITKLNDLTASVQNFLIGYTGPFPNIVSSGSDHTFNIPIAGIAATGLVSTLAQSFAGAKTFTSTVNPTFIGQGGVIVHGGIGISGNAAIGGSAIFTNRTNTNTISFYAGVQGNTLAYILPIDTPTAGQVLSASAPSSGVVTLSWEDDQTGAPAGGITQLNGLTAATQSFQTGTAGVDFGISSATSTHTFNLPDASATARGVITTGAQTIAGAKTFSSSIIGNLTGTATTSENVNVTTTTRSLTHYLTFTNQTSGSGLGLTTSAVGIGFTVNPAQNTLAAGTFIGNLSGTAATATNFYGTLVGNSSTATTSQNVNVNTTTAGGSFFLTFTNQSSGSGLALTTSTIGIGFTVNPAQNTLAAGTFIGNLSGIAATATNFYGTHIGNVTGTATTSQNVNVTTTTAGGSFFLTFTNQSSGSGLALTTSTIGIGFTVNPAQNTLAAGTFIGNLSGTAATATNFYGTHIGNVTGTATTSQNVNVTTTTRSTDHYLLFTNASSGSGLALTTSTVGMGLTYNPATNTLSAQFFTGTATTARNVDVTSTTINSTHYLTFTNATSGSGLALTTSTVGVGLTYNPAQNTLGAGTFVGNVSGAATTSTFITGILRNASYVQGDLLAGASTGNTLTRLPVGATNRYFLKPDSTTQSGLGWSTFAGVFVTSLAPASPAFTLLEGDLWYKVDDGSFNVYYTDVDETAQWVEIVSAGAGGGGGAGAAGGSAFEVQYNSGGVLDGDPNLVWGPSTPSLTLKGFPVDAQTGCALQILGPAKTITASTGTFLGINSASGYSGKMIDVQNNDSVKFSVASDGATTIATLVSNGAVYSNGGTLTNSNPSDQNLKENIQSMIGGTTIVNQLNPVSFEWKSGVGGTGTKYGFIAQEVQAIIPDIVSTDSSGTIGIDTVSIIPFLVKSIKEQQETIEQLRAEIQFIKTELGI